MAPPSVPFVSIIVTVFNDERLLRNCLASLLKLDYPLERREILIVDNGSTDRTAAIIKSHPVQYLFEPRRGTSHARNRGIEASRGEIVAFTDPDCVVSTRWLAELVIGFADEQVGGVAGAIVPYPPQSTAEIYAARRRSYSQERSIDHAERSFAMTPNVAFRREVFVCVGLFDTRFPGGGWEDADLCWRLRGQTSLLLRYAPRALVFHRYRSTAWDFFVQHYRYGYGLGLIYRKYRSELRCIWSRRVLGYQDLIKTAFALTTAGILYGLHRGKTQSLVFRYLDFLREIGQRAGFVAAVLCGK